MKIAVIGASGFVGNRLVEHLHLGTDHTVVPVVRTPSRLALPARFDLPWRLGDALDAASLTAALAGCDAVVHAALGDPRQIEAMPGVLAAAAAASDVRRVIYLSTAAVHGQAPAPATDEASPLHTGHPLEYNNAKVRAERNFFRACARHGLAGFALRPGLVHGPRSRWITEAAADLRHGRAWLFNGGGGICNGIYVDNLCAGIVAALLAPPTVSGAYLVGDRETYTWRDFYQHLATGLGLGTPDLPCVERFPAFRHSPALRLRRLLAHPVPQQILPLVPRRIKRVTQRLLAAAQTPPPPPAWRLPVPPAPRITEELALLQQCQWKLPHTLAAAQLGYRPGVTFAEAMARSVAWLKFAEAPAFPSDVIHQHALPPAALRC